MHNAMPDPPPPRPLRNHPVIFVAQSAHCRPPTRPDCHNAALPSASLPPSSGSRSGTSARHRSHAQWIPPSQRARHGHHQGQPSLTSDKPSSTCVSEPKSGHAPDDSDTGDGDDDVFLAALTSSPFLFFHTSSVPTLLSTLSPVSPAPPLPTPSLTSSHSCPKTPSLHTQNSLPSPSLPHACQPHSTTRLCKTASNGLLHPQTMAVPACSWTVIISHTAKAFRHPSSLRTCATCVTPLRKYAAQGRPWCRVTCGARLKSR
ncbi:hypothetical protein BCR44DRAFT_1156421 [Catenaria anguillulae PL171]|uniref:Uncharacterized protein n=1 Tax=Catenaria anguillulae PL171 TaxID=765915 RepID=A0A1Y2HID7_9FUNG|nr:hypothetical protein BCR44DRAFT_1156421 [Catenaria anguillulae PL171]